MPDASAVRIRVRVHPRAGRDRIAGRTEDLLHVRIAAAPVDGAANAAVVRVIAKALRIAPSRVVVASGAHSRIKTIEIHGVASDDVDRLGRAGPGDANGEAAAP